MKVVKSLIFIVFTVTALAETEHLPLAERAAHLRYNEIVWPLPHNTYAHRHTEEGDGVHYTYAQQNLTIQEILNAGFRVLDFDVHIDESGVFKQGEAYLAHGSLRTDRFLRLRELARRKASTTLKHGLEIVKRFLDDHPTEIITIFFEDYVHNNPLFDSFIKDAQLDQFALKPDWDAEWHQGQWPTLGEMVTNNQRLVLFKSREGSNYIRHIWHDVAGTNYGTLNLTKASQLRPETLNNTRPNYLFGSSLYHGLEPEEPTTRLLYVLTVVRNYLKRVDYDDVNSALLEEYIELLKKTYNRIPNFPAVNFADRGQVLALAESINQRTMSDETFRKQYFGRFPKESHQGVES
jgi:hypothetical protein